MKLNHVIQIQIVLLGLFHSSCATKLTPAQRSALQTVAVAPTEVAANAYGDPYGGDRKFSHGAATVGVSSGTGAIGGLAGSLIGEAVAATQNTVYHSAHQDSFEAIRKNTPQVGPILHAKLVDEVKKDRFCGPRITNDSPNRITSKIVSYRLVRSGKAENGGLLLTPEITADIWLVSGDGNRLIGKTYQGSGMSHPTSVYANNPRTTQEGYEFAVRVAVDAFTADLARQTAE